MKKRMISTAILAALSGIAYAQEPMFRNAASAGAVMASDLIGARIYASEAVIDADEYAGLQANWTDIGEINDVILSRNGVVETVLVDVGGFLGVGERQVAVDMTALRFVADSATADNADDWFLVMNGNKATIEAAPEWTTNPDTTAADVAPSDPATDAILGTGLVPDEDKATATVTQPSQGLMRDGYSTLAATDLTAEVLQGATAYDATDANVGEVSAVTLTADGLVESLVIDVGGFLGMGKKPVLLTRDQVQILRQTDGADIRVYIALTKEELEAMPAYVM